MRSSTRGSATWMVVLGLLVAVFALGCNDGTEDMYKQISAGGGNKPAASKPADAAQPAAGGPKAAAPVTEGQPAESATPAGEYTGPKVKIVVKEVKPPYPQFEGKGYYDVAITAQADEHLDYAVWNVFFFDKDGVEVAKLTQATKISYTEPIDLRFTDVYCKSKPVTIEFQKTDKIAKKAAPEEEGGTGNRGKGGGGASIGGTGAS